MPSARELWGRWGFCLPLLLLWLIAWRYSGNREEDFVYYYCSGQVLAQGASPYDAAPYQLCIQERLKRPNPNVSQGTGFPYSPSSLLAFGLLARLPYGAAFLAWNLVLALAACWSWYELSLLQAGEGFWVGLLFFTNPSFVLGWGYHKLTLALFPLLLWGLRQAAAGRVISGALALSLLAFKPQLFPGVCLYLAIRRQRLALLWTLALAAAAQAPAIVSHGLPLFYLWLKNLLYHSGNVLTFDNQSLFVCLYKPFRFLWQGPMISIQMARYGFFAALLICAGTQPFASYWALYLLALPYSTAADAILALPLLLQILSKRPRLCWAAAVGLQLLFALAVGGLAAEHLARIPYQYAEGYLTLLIALAAFFAPRA